MFPVLLQFNYVVIYTYGLFLAFAILGFLWGVHFYIRYTKQPTLFFQKHFLGIGLSFLLGAKVSHMLFHFSEVTQRLWIYFMHPLSWGEFVNTVGYLFSTGYLMTPGILTALLYIYFAAKKEGQSYFRWADLTGLGVVIALLIGLVGAFLGGYYYGTPSTLPWALTFESSVHSPIKFLSPIHPLQLYALLFFGGLFFIMTRLFHHAKLPGLTSGVALTGSAIALFLFEYIRGDSIPLGSLTVHQYLLIAPLALGILHLIHALRRHLP